jgi:hypothetical protein
VPGVTTASRTGRVASVLLAVAAVAGGLGLLRRARRRRATGVLFTDAPLPPVAPPRDRNGDVRERGQTPTYGLDVDGLRREAGFEPVVQYLTYIQSQRGNASHLLFVRYDDLDAMAALEGQVMPAFLERLDQLGVVVSTN